MYTNAPTYHVHVIITDLNPGGAWSFFLNVLFYNNLLIPKNCYLLQTDAHTYPHFFAKNTDEMYTFQGICFVLGTHLGSHRMEIAQTLGTMYRSEMRK